VLLPDVDGDGVEGEVCASTLSGCAIAAEPQSAHNATTAESDVLSNITASAKQKGVQPASTALLI